jgi:hypothetical protein
MTPWRTASRDTMDCARRVDSDASPWGLQVINKVFMVISVKV